MLGWLPNAASAAAVAPSSGESALQAGRVEQGSTSCLDLTQGVNDRFRCNARRGIVILKLPRTGSTWLVHALNSTGKWCHVVDEATNIVFDPSVARQHGTEPTYNCYDAGLRVKEALACPGHPAMHGGLSINPLKFLGAPPPESFLALRLKPHPEEARYARERYARALEGIDWAPGHSEAWNASLWARGAQDAPDVNRAEAHEHDEARGEAKSRGQEKAGGDEKAREEDQGRGEKARGEERAARLKARGEMKCRGEEVGAMAGPSPPRLMTLLRSNFVQQAASLIRAAALSRALKSCDGWHPERCREEEDLRLLKQKLPVPPDDLLAKAEVLEHASANVRRVATEISKELGTSLYHTTYEELEAAGGGDGMALPPDLEEYLGLEQGSYAISVPTVGSTHRADHATWDEGPRLRADILNFGELRAYFEAHASAEQLRMLME